MPNPLGFIAFDLGAESGRTILASLQSDTISLQEINRFLNLPQHTPSGYHWAIIETWRHLQDGLTKAAAHARKNNIDLISLGVDTWGVDYALLGPANQLLGLPFAYRDDRNPPAMQAALQTIPPKDLYAATGIQFLPFNSLFQLLAQKHANPIPLQHAQHILFIPDLLHYFFSGIPANEATIASTSQMLNPRTGKWATQLFAKLHLPTHFLHNIRPAASTLGPITPDIASRCNCPPIKVILPGSHDTASAIAAVPVDTQNSSNWAYLSSGTWSLMGAEIDQPILTDAAREAGFTNERGVENKIRFLKNIAGLWLVQEVRRDYLTQGTTYDYPELTTAAAQADPFRTLINPAHAPFSTPNNIHQKIADFATTTSQPIPQTHGQLTRTCLESLAFAYRDTHRKLQTLLKQPIDTLHIVGGGGKNDLLNQMTADATGCTVIVGPYEATAIGNALTQAIGSRHVRNLHHLRQIVRNSFDLKTFSPQNTTAYDHQADRFADLCQTDTNC
ncbi:Rhamnulokinase [Poriferisphaera corsica]|uniref:Rhamnulokinase n=1 Tax=Poriferisphaera corsica TaxID=2528020 RepID=A0A517YV24_9BACT|nr:rhamnulokinase family protein [Poriferisphaera corsica]QDU34099.1 Rhamnulokinase [Poriferisphaera corsica]